jgi:hypothetical protein
MPSVKDMKQFTAPIAGHAYNVPGFAFFLVS